MLAWVESEERAMHRLPTLISIASIGLCASAALADAASKGEKEALKVAPQKEPKLEALADDYRAAIAKPARDLKKREADIILAFLHHAGFIQLMNGGAIKAPVISGDALKWPLPADRVGLQPWVKFADAGEPLPAGGTGKGGR